MIKEQRISWEEYALRIAEAAASRSEDPYKKVGACAIGYDKRVISTGYNGAPPKIEIDWSNREERLKRVLHAEENCLKFCRPNEVEFIATTISPCSECIKIISAYYVKRVVFRDFYKRDEFAIKLAKEFGIELIQLK